MSILGIDFGKKWIGLAISDGEFAQGIGCFQTGEVVERIRALIKQEEMITTIVIGRPEGRLKEAVEKFGSALHKHFNIPIIFWEETLTSRAARERLSELGARNKSRKTKEHQVAATLLLQDYLDSRKTSFVYDS
ncbi:Holliday junction resolvase RuvX [Candidatus Gottesmanbacteria bacterium]|nr:Holliday junction resolvase RuvX [Candidatus Gottesmanbacteria bacterium]